MNDIITSLLNSYATALLKLDYDKLDNLYHKPSIVMHKDHFTAILEREVLKEFCNRLHSAIFKDDSLLDEPNFTFEVSKIHTYSPSLNSVRAILSSATLRNPLTILFVISGKKEDEMHILAQVFESEMRSEIFAKHRADEFMTNPDEQVLQSLSEMINEMNTNSISHK